MQLATTSGPRIFDTRARVWDLRRDPFAAIFGTRRGLAAKMRRSPDSAPLDDVRDYRTLALDLGSHDAPYAEFSKHPSFQPVLSSCLFQLRSQDEREKLFRVHLGLSTASTQEELPLFAVMIVERYGFHPDSPFEARIHAYGALKDALNHASGYLVNRTKTHPADPGDPTISFTDFTAPMFDTLFRRRLAAS